MLVVIFINDRIILVITNGIASNSGAALKPTPFICALVFLVFLTRVMMFAATGLDGKPILGMGRSTTRFLCGSVFAV